MLYRDQAGNCDAVAVRPANCKTHPVIEKVIKDETRPTKSSFCLGCRKTVASSKSAMNAAMLEEDSCTAALPADNTFSKCLFCVQFASG